MFRTSFQIIQGNAVSEQYIPRITRIAEVRGGGPVPAGRCDWKQAPVDSCHGFLVLKFNQGFEFLARRQAPVIEVTQALLIQTSPVVVRVAFNPTTAPSTILDTCLAAVR